MDLTPEDDDLLSYFLSADVAGEELAPSALPRADALNTAGSAPLYPSLGGGGSSSSSGGGATVGAATEPFALSGGQQAGASSGGGGAMASLGPLSTLQQMQNAYHAAENAMMRSSSADEEAMSGAGLDSDEKRQRRCGRRSTFLTIVWVTSLIISPHPCVPRRLARNRESARQSRRRKKQYLELLEEKVRVRLCESKVVAETVTLCVRVLNERRCRSSRRASTPRARAISTAPTRRSATSGRRSSRRSRRT